MLKCKYCDKECKNKNSLAQHEIRCRMNHNRTAMRYTSETARNEHSGIHTHGLEKHNNDKKFSLEDILNGSYPKYCTGKLKKRLIKDGILKYECVLCLNDGTHNGLALTLQLDHINGVNNDHRLENLRLLCPNCHTQQDTYAGKNKPKKVKEIQPSFAEIKLQNDKDKWNKIRNNPDLRIGEWGWRVRVGKELGVTPQKINGWLKRVDPRFNLGIR